MNCDRESLENREGICVCDNGTILGHSRKFFKLNLPNAYINLRSNDLISDKKLGNSVLSS